MFHGHFTRQLKEGYCANYTFPSDRNVIEAAIKLPQEQFDKLTRHMSQIGDRAVTAKMTLDKTLVLDHQGCLIIEDATDAIITDLVWTFSLSSSLIKALNELFYHFRLRLEQSR